MDWKFEEGEPFFRIFHEANGDGGQLTNVCICNDGRTYCPPTKVVHSTKSIFGKSFNRFLQDVFLPEGYPDTVSPDYLSYQLWDTLQAFASSITSTFATKAIFRGMGVGDADATPLAATFTWLLKDGTGMVGRLLFAWSRGSSLDSQCKKWRIFADILNDSAILLEIVTPFFPAFAFTPAVCVAAVSKSIVGVAGGATRAALTQHQARAQNMADVSAKDGSQETLVNLVALVASLLLVALVGDDHRMIFLIVALFTCLHLYANYRAVRSVVMNSFNRSRLRICIDHYLKTGELPSVELVNSHESIFDFFNQSREHRILFGCQLATLLNTSVIPAVELLKLYDAARPLNGYIVTLDADGVVLVSLRENLSVPEEIRAFFNAIVLQGQTSNTFERLRILEETDPVFQRFWELIRSSEFITNFVQLDRSAWTFSEP